MNDALTPPQDRPPYIAALSVSLVVLAGYIASLAPTVTFWDAGEFIARSYKLLVPHPPGAPFYLLVGRLFSMFASEPSQVK